jgi:hypothetical protein
MRKLIGVLVVLVLFAFMGCKEKMDEQKPIADTTKAVAPIETTKVITPAPATTKSEVVAAKPAGIISKNKNKKTK